MPEFLDGTAESLEPTFSIDSVPYSPEWLNALSDAEKQSVAMTDFSRSMHNSGGEHVAWLLWSTQEKAKPTPLEYRQGSMFFLDCGRGPFAVTAGHVFEQFVKDRAERRVRGYQLGNIGFDLEERLIDWGNKRKIDLATFRITPDEIAAVGKQVVRGTDGRWPAPPNVGDVVYFGGFPGAERIEVAPAPVPASPDSRRSSAVSDETGPPPRSGC
ncbi:hypothetical protein [Tardiphaga sp. 768_D3_N2_1]|uniref:hypothetical protein n=1 Tax=Tardiphaga sp. 768_D3_N2_1 TaxID=3240783 RepID=UPI003F898027